MIILKSQDHAARIALSAMAEAEILLCDFRKNQDSHFLIRKSERQQNASRVPNFHQLFITRTVFLFLGLCLAFLCKK